MPKKLVRQFFFLVFVAFIVLNVLAAFHAYKFTHFAAASGTKMERLHLTTIEKLKILFTGIDNPRPVDDLSPQYQYETIHISSNVNLECWLIHSFNRYKGTVIMFHGYTSNKSRLLERADTFLKDGYNCLLVDFMGSGGSGGNSTTIGYYEAQEVYDCYKYIQQKEEHDIYLYGSSMGAVATMKATKDYNIKPSAIIIECPFGTMYKTVCARFHILHLPTFPMAGIMVFWGGLENGFWGFSHNPVRYARYIECPVLMQYDAKDDRVSMQEINEIYANIKAPKTLIVYKQAGHDDYLIKAPKEWKQNVCGFLDTLNKHQ